MNQQVKRTLLGALAMATTLTAREFYVDSAQGKDTAEGTTPATAWQSLARVNAAEILPGNTVRFACGGEWRGTLMPHSGTNSKRRAGRRSTRVRRARLHLPVQMVPMATWWK